MESKRDIRDREDIKILVDAFYEKVLKDQEIGFYFTEIAKINLEEHLHKMYDFWENALFYNGSYKGNLIEVHSKINHQEKIENKHFTKWLTLFNETLDSFFEGEKTEEAKFRAYSIAKTMEIKINV